MRNWKFGTDNEEFWIHCLERDLRGSVKCYSGCGILVGFNFSIVAGTVCLG
jgi:hypothetical protein